MYRITQYWPVFGVLLVVLFFGSIALASASTLPASATEAATSLSPSGMNYQLKWDVVGGGGTEMTSTSYTLMATVGQPAIGEMSSENYNIGSGYWYQFVRWLTMLPLISRAGP